MGIKGWAAFVGALVAVAVFAIIASAIAVVGIFHEFVSAAAFFFPLLFVFVFPPVFCVAVLIVYSLPPEKIGGRKFLGVVAFCGFLSGAAGYVALSELADGISIAFYGSLGGISAFAGGLMASRTLRGRTNTL